MGNEVVVEREGRLGVIGRDEEIGSLKSRGRRGREESWSRYGVLIVGLGSVGLIL